MLQEVFALLQKIEESIVHKTSVRIFTNETRLIIQADFRCKKDNQVYGFERIFSRHEMMKCNEDQLVDDFISRANKQIRHAYGMSQFNRLLCADDKMKKDSSSK
jgi:hypothetical protein